MVGDWRDVHKKSIASALEVMRRTPDKPYVVITDTTTGKFVQFFTHGAQLLLDLPTAQIMSPTELLEAEKLLGKAELTKMGKRSPRSSLVFHAGPFNDSDVAAALALDVMQRVFTASGHELSVQNR